MSTANGATAPAATLPADTRVEGVLLGGVLHDPAALVTLTPTPLPADFYLPRHQLLWGAVSSHADTRAPGDVISVAHTLEQAGHLEQAGGLEYLAALLAAARNLGALPLAHYVGVLRGLAGQRALIAAGEQIARLGYAGGDGLYDAAETALFSVTHADRAAANFVPLADLISPWLTALRAQQDAQAAGTRRVGIPSGIADLDRLVCLRPGQLIIPAGRPKEGKTALALGLAEAAARAGYKVAVVSLEMSSDDVLDRLHSMLGNVNLHAIRTASLDDGDWVRLIGASDQLYAAPLCLWDRGTLTVPTLRREVQRLIQTSGCDVLVVDYLQLLTAARDSGNRATDVATITRALKQLAMDLKVAVIAPSQLSRAVEGRATHRPQLSDLRESGSIENDADVVIFIHRPTPTIPAQAQLLIAAHRNGPTGDIDVYWKASNARFCGVDQYADAH